MLVSVDQRRDNLGAGNSWDRTTLSSLTSSSIFSLCDSAQIRVFVLKFIIQNKMGTVF